MPMTPNDRRRYRTGIISNGRKDRAARCAQSPPAFSRDSYYESGRSHAQNAAQGDAANTGVIGGTDGNTSTPI